MVKTTLLEKEYTLRLTMGAVSTFVSLTSKQPDYVFDLASRITNDKYEPTGEDMLYVSALVFSCMDSSIRSAGGDEVSFDTFNNEADYSDVLDAFISIVVNEVEKREKKSLSTQKGS